MSNYKSKYFFEREEIIRLICAASGKNYSDDRIEFEKWAEQKNKAQLPYLKFGSVELSQSMAIARLVSRETGLSGKNNMEQAQADAIVETILELVNHYTNILNIHDDDEKAEAFRSFIVKQGAEGAKNVEKLIEMYGSNGYSVGDSLTWADLIIFEVVFSLLNIHPEFSNKFPILNKVYNLVRANPGVSNYVKNRPKSPF